MSCENPQASCCGAATRTGECIGICAVQAPCGECPGCTGSEEPHEPEVCAAADPLRGPVAGEIWGIPVIEDPALDPGFAIVEQHGRPIARIALEGGPQPARLPGGAS